MIAARSLVRSERARGVPYLMEFADGRKLAVEVPAGMARRDRGGDLCFTPAGVKFLDRLRALFMPLRRVPTPGLIRVLRSAMKLTQTQFGQAVGVDKMTVFRWEKGTLRPGAASTRRIARLRARVVRGGVLIESE